jgi:hypothetical protein
MQLVIFCVSAWGHGKAWERQTTVRLDAAVADLGTLHEKQQAAPSPAVRTV